MVDGNGGEILGGYCIEGKLLVKPNISFKEVDEKLKKIFSKKNSEDP